MSKQLAFNIDGLRSGLLGNNPIDAAYIDGVNARARKLAKACAVKPRLPKSMSACPEKLNPTYVFSEK